MWPWPLKRSVLVVMWPPMSHISWCPHPSSVPSHARSGPATDLAAKVALGQGQT